MRLIGYNGHLRIIGYLSIHDSAAHPRGQTKIFKMNVN